jgi:hypothetical protein
MRASGCSWSREGCETVGVTSQKFTVALEVGPGDGVAIRLPFDPRAVFGKVRAPVLVGIDQHPAFPTTVMAYSGAAWIGLRKGQIEEMSLHAGDQVRVHVELDDAPRTVDVPPELAAALEQDPDARAAYVATTPPWRAGRSRWLWRRDPAQLMDRGHKNADAQFFSKLRS